MVGVIRGGAALGAVIVVCAPVAAQEEPRREGRAELATFLESCRAGRWEAACQAWSELEALEAAPARLRCLAAEAHLLGSQPERSAALLRPLLQERTPRVDALYLAARVAHRAGDAARARELLLRAAWTGQSVLYDLARDPSLAPLLNERPEFSLELLEACRRSAPPPIWRDPFARAPRVEADEPPPLPPPSLQGLRDALRVARERAAAQDLAGLDEALTRLRREVEAVEAGERGRAREVYAEAERALAQLGERAHALRLQLLVGRGNELLRSLARRAQAADLEGVRREHAELVRLCEARVEVELLAATRRRLRVRGDAILAEAERDAELAALELPVTGIVIPPEESAQPRRAIVAGQIVGPGDVVELPGRPLDAKDPAAVRVERIGVGRVVFRCRGVSFTRSATPTLAELE